MFLKQRCVLKIYHKADENNKMSTTRNCDFDGEHCSSIFSNLWDWGKPLSFVKNYASYKNTSRKVSLLHRRSSKKQNKIKKHLNIRKVIFLLPYLIWFGAQSVHESIWQYFSGRWQVRCSGSHVLSHSFHRSPDVPWSWRGWWQFTSQWCWGPWRLPGPYMAESVPL